ncbi:MAG: AraC family ligand binding domain-containing protein, partial [Planctomycetes bacterium]|nr:AraC family ligand binding domain-containing protein [Planctomycetota bacterium]
MGVERHRDRLAYTLGDCLVPELQHCGWTRLRAANDAALSAHAHVGWEICWVRRGGVDWWAGDGAWHVGQGDCYVTHPGEAHGGVHTVLERCELFWLSIAPVAKSLPGMDAADARTLLDRLTTLPRVFAAEGDALNGL